MDVTFYAPGQYPEDEIAYAVVVAQYHGRWVFCRHKDRTTWEHPGGHRETGETPLQTAYRELFEETGAVKLRLQVLGAYKISRFGLLCFAEIAELGPIPAGSEIAEIRLFDTFPQNITYDAHRKMFDRVQAWLAENDM